MGKYNQTFSVVIFKNIFQNNFKENGVVQEDNRSVKMGATGSPNTARLTELQEKKKSIEEKLASCNKELKQLCIQVCFDLHLL